MDELLVRERIADILMVLSSINAGSAGERLPATEDADDPFAVLYEGINEVVERLLAGQARLASYQRDLEARRGVRGTSPRRLRPTSRDAP